MTKLALVVESTDDISAERLERARRAFDLKMRGQRLEKIADDLGCSRSTVIRLLSDYRELYAKRLNESPAIHRISEHLAKLEGLENDARERAETAGSDRDRQGYLRLVLRAIKAQNDLMLATGLIPKEPEKIYALTHSLDSEPDDEERTEDEIRQDVWRLLRQARNFP